MEKRLDKCAAAGFDGVYFDVTWEWQVGKDVTGWNISYETQLLYNVAMLNMAHMHNLAAGINYDLLQIKDLVAQEDFHIDESCFDYNECDYLLPVTKAGKPVLQIEYFADPASVCSQQPKPYDFNTEFKNQDLFDHPWSTCR
jgi:endo-alpha-1,4-polygalactosaminidase (GH114 family)